MTDALQKAMELPKRFYKDVTVSEESGLFRVLLDGRSVRTPGKAVLEMASEAVVGEIADEWRAQGEFINPATMPMTRLVNTVIDGIAPDPQLLLDDLVRYTETDLLIYRANSPERLVERQAMEWDPLIVWISGRLGGAFNITSGIMHVSQPAETLEAFRVALAAVRDPFRLAALHQMTTLTGSLILAFAVAEGRITADEAFRLAHVDEDWNIELWGEDAEAAARRAARAQDMEAAGRLWLYGGGNYTA